jgi:RNA polymerase sigma-70 factor, ECF subfamily
MFNRDCGRPNGKIKGDSMPDRIQKLCTLAQQGDTAAASELLQLFYKKIFCYLRRLTAHTAAAEDLTQETFAALWASLNTYRRQCSFSSWLHRIAYHKYIDWCRAQKKSSDLPEYWWQALPDKTPNPYTRAEEKQLAEKLCQAVDRLEEDKKQAVHLHYYQGLSLRETAAALNRSTAAVKYRLREALKQLSFQLDTAKNPESENISQPEKKVQNAKL